MSTNISEIMYELESHGIPKERVADIVTRLLIAGQAVVYAGNDSQAPSKRRSLVDPLGVEAASRAVIAKLDIRSS